MCFYINFGDNYESYWCIGLLSVSIILFYNLSRQLCALHMYVFLNRAACPLQLYNTLINSVNELSCDVILQISVFLSQIHPPSFHSVHNFVFLHIYGSLCMESSTDIWLPLIMQRVVGRLTTLVFYSILAVLKGPLLRVPHRVCSTPVASLVFVSSFLWCTATVRNIKCLSLACCSLVCILHNGGLIYPHTMSGREELRQRDRPIIQRLRRLCTPSPTLLTLPWL